ncbi:hypothetical protein GWK75_01115 [Candidatus Saccharibacteria bacterium oral taxon 955]|nr:hypothetical protein GWK75_01115 [Candidatus Saccharibacteria bacterium oral taxon 955]
MAKQNPESIHRTNLEELGADAELYADQKPVRYTYDPENTPTLTTAQMSKIEQAVLSAADAGETTEQQQVIADEMLAKIGFDPSTAVDGVQVGYIESDDGKRELRAFVSDCRDIGTSLRNVEFEPMTNGLSEIAVDKPAEPNLREQIADLQAFAERVADSNVASLDGSDANDGLDTRSPEDSIGELYRHQELAIETIRAELIDRVNRLEYSFDETSQERQRYRRALDEMLDEVDSIVMKLRQAESVDSGSIRRLIDDYAGPASRAVSNDTTGIESDKRAILELQSAIEDIESEARTKLDEESYKKIKSALNSADSAISELLYDRGVVAYETDEARSYFNRMMSLIDQMQHDRLGMEAYGSEIGSSLCSLRDSLATIDRRQKRLPASIGDLKSRLTAV